MSSVDEIQALYCNDDARLANRFASCCSHSISNFRSMDNRRIPNFPITYTQFKDTEQVDEVLECLALSTNGSLSFKKAHLKMFLGCEGRSRAGSEW